MRAITRDQLLTLIGISSPGMDQLQHAGHVALAFGSMLPATPGRYVDLDLVGMALASGLTPFLGRATVTVLVLSFFDLWVAAVGRADADTTQAQYFAVCAVGWDPKKKHAKDLYVTTGTMDEVAKDFRGAGGTVAAANITEILAMLRQQGRDTGIDLSQPFFFPPDHPRFAEIITEFEQMREERVERFRRDKRFSKVKARMKHGDIKVVPRLKDAR